METRERILRAAEELFSEKGFDGTSVRSIVSRAKVTNPMLYYYFGSKEELLEEVIATRCQEYEALLAESLSHARTPREVFSGATRAVLTAARANPEGMRLLFSSLTNPGLRGLRVRMREFGIAQQQRLVDALTSHDPDLDKERVGYAVGLYDFVISGLLLARFPDPVPQLPAESADAIGETFAGLLRSDFPQSIPRFDMLLESSEET